jgi:hypothetical protein
MSYQVSMGLDSRFYNSKEEMYNMVQVIFMANSFWEFDVLNEDGSKYGHRYAGHRAVKTDRCGVGSKVEMAQLQRDIAELNKKFGYDLKVKVSK